MGSYYLWSSIRIDLRAYLNIFLCDLFLRLDVVLVILLLTLNIFRTFSSVSIVDFEQANQNWVIPRIITPNHR